jgi:putative transposase
MPWPSAAPVPLSARQRRVLGRLLRASTTPQAVAVRARIVCAADEGTSTRQIAQRLGLSRNTAQLWRERWTAAAEALLAAEAEGGPEDDRALEAVARGVLTDAPRPGAPSTCTPEQLCQIMAVA